MTIITTVGLAGLILISLMGLFYYLHRQFSQLKRYLDATMRTVQHNAAQLAEFNAKTTQSADQQVAVLAEVRKQFERERLFLLSVNKQMTKIESLLAVPNFPTTPSPGNATEPVHVLQTQSAPAKQQSVSVTTQTPQVRSLHSYLRDGPSAKPKQEVEIQNNRTDAQWHVAQAEKLKEMAAMFETENALGSSINAGHISRVANG